MFLKSLFAEVLGLPNRLVLQQIVGRALVVAVQIGICIFAAPGAPSHPLSYRPEVGVYFDKGFCSAVAWPYTCGDHPCEGPGFCRASYFQKVFLGPNRRSKVRNATLEPSPVGAFGCLLPKLAFDVLPEPVQHSMLRDAGFVHEGRLHCGAVSLDIPCHGSPRDPSDVEYRTDCSGHRAPGDRPAVVVVAEPLDFDRQGL